MVANESPGISSHAGHFEEGGFFGALANKQTYLNILYLLLSFPLGIFYFIVLITGLSLGFGLAIIGIGILILLVMFLIMRGFAAWERQLSVWLLGTFIAPPDPRPEPLKHPLIALKKYITDSYTWKSLAYFLVKFPLAIASFVITVFIVSFSLALISAPLLYRHAPVHFFMWRVDRAEEALLCLAVGFIFALVSVHVLNGVAVVHRALASAMLSGAHPPQSQPKTGPIIIP
jgi:hypothetical protein